MFSIDGPAAAAAPTEPTPVDAAACGRPSVGAAAAPVSFEEGTAGAAVQCAHPYGLVMSLPLNINSTPVCPVCQLDQLAGGGPGKSAPEANPAAAGHRFPCAADWCRVCERIAGQ